MGRKGAFRSSQGAAVVFTLQGMIDDEGAVGLGRALGDTRTASRERRRIIFFFWDNALVALSPFGVCSHWDEESQGMHGISLPHMHAWVAVEQIG